MKVSRWIEIFQIAQRYPGDAEKATRQALEIEAMLHEHPAAMEE